MSAEIVAQRRRERDEAVAARAEALAAVSALQERIDRRVTAREAITQRRLADAAEPADVAEFMALARDIEVLETLLTEKRAAALAVDVDGAAARLAEAEAAHQREQDEVAFAAHQQRCREIDAALVGAIAATAAIGARLGYVRMAQIFEPSFELDRALRLRVVPK